MLLSLEFINFDGLLFPLPQKIFSSLATDFIKVQFTHNLNITKNKQVNPPQAAASIGYIIQKVREVKQSKNQGLDFSTELYRMGFLRQSDVLPSSGAYL